MTLIDDVTLIFDHLPVIIAVTNAKMTDNNVEGPEIFLAQYGNVTNMPNGRPVQNAEMKFT